MKENSLSFLLNILFCYSINSFFIDCLYLQWTMKFAIIMILINSIKIIGTNNYLVVDLKNST